MLNTMLLLTFRTFANIGIESQDSVHTFQNGTGGYNIWTYPTNASGFQIFGGTAVERWCFSLLPTLFFY
ncbi:MAG: hypothetical protein HC785_19225 [Calothrix sp. CSU_2_0]|nr:hypothetical protein [Calothrix sp. CSU_2_0]